MSTKAIREALDALKRVTGLEPVAARAEVAAIERAAKVIAEWGVGDVVGLQNQPAWEAAFNAAGECERIMESIAKDAP